MSDLKNLFKKPNFGLLMLRMVVGAAMICFGVPKFLGGKGALKGVGESMGLIGVTYFPVFWGFMAALSETLGGFLMILGYKFRWAMFFMMFTMLVATATKYSPFSGFQAYAFPMVMAVLFLSLLFVGPGKFSVDGE